MARRRCVYIRYLRTSAIPRDHGREQFYMILKHLNSSDHCGSTTA